jgi:hypothetical protein
MTLRATKTKFLQTFFGDANGIHLENLTPSAREHLEPWLVDLADPADLPVLLPRIMGDTVYWYVLSFSDQQLRTVAAELLGLIGLSYTDFDGIPRPVSTADAVDQAASTLTEGRAFRVRVLPGDQATRDQVRDELLLLRQLWSERPAHAAVVPRPTGRILRDFEMALQAGLEGESQTLLEELRSHSRLTASNLLFLRIHRLAELRLWAEMLNLPELESVLQMRRPSGVSEDLRRAVYLHHLVAHERDGDALETMRHFREEIAPRFSGLMQVGPGHWSLETAKLLMLHAIVSDPQLPQLASDALNLVAKEPDRQFLLKLMEGIAQPVTREPAPLPLELAIADLEAGRFASAADALRSAPPSRTRTEILIRCAYETGTIELAGLASSALAQLDAQERSMILRQRWYKDQWEAVQAEGASSSGDLPTDWAAWLRWVDKGADAKLALRVAQDGAVQWSADDSAGDSQRTAEITDLLGSRREGAALELVRQAVPHMLTCMRRSDDPGLRPIYEGLFLLMAYDSLHSPGDLEVLLDLLEEFLVVGVDAGQYASLVSTLTDVWTSVDSPRYLDWALDALEVLVTYPSQSATERSHFASVVMGSLAKWGRRLDEHQWDIASDLFDDIGSGAQFEGIRQSATAGGPKPQVAAEGLIGAAGLKRIAVYSLTESVLLRVQSLIERALPGVVVDLCSDKVGSDRLRQLARQADVFLMAPRSAKHAATDFIKANRSDKPLLVASGSGSASLIREFFTHLATRGEK